MNNMMTTKVTAAAVLIAALLLNVSSAGAETLNGSHRGHQICQVTDYGDGIKISEYADQSGFEVVGGGARFIYDKNSKQMTCIKDGVTLTFLSDGQLAPSAAPNIADEVASR